MKWTKPAQKKAFWGWAWWAPQVALAVGVGGFHVWTSIQIRHNDYEMSGYRRELESLNAELRDVKVEMARREDMDTLNVTAEELGFKPPRPDQIVRLAYTAETYEHPAPPVVDASTAPATAPEQGEQRRQRAIELARKEPVAPRETGRMTIAQESGVAYAPEAVIVSAPAATEVPVSLEPAVDTALDGSVEELLGAF